MNCRRVSYRDRTSLVSSLYFDDARLSACRENVDGSGRRSKVRLRWYDAPFPGGSLFFEIKRRRGQTTSKERVPLALTRPLEEAPLAETMRALSRSLPPDAGGSPPRAPGSDRPRRVRAKLFRSRRAPDHSRPGPRLLLSGGTPAPHPAVRGPGEGYRDPGSEGACSRAKTGSGRYCTPSSREPRARRSTSSGARRSAYSAAPTTARSDQARLSRFM